jgi:hypothetical protein
MFGPKNISLRSNTAGWSMLLGEKLSSGGISLSFGASQGKKTANYRIIRYSSNPARGAAEFSGFTVDRELLV